MNSKEDIHHLPLTMKMPLIILTLGAIFSGYVGYNLLDIAEYDSALWQNIIPANQIMEKIHHTPPLIKYLPLIIAIFGIVMAAIYYRYNKDLPKNTVNNFHRLYILFYNKWFFDQIYNKYIILPYYKLAKFASVKLDKNIIDAYGPNGFAKLTNFAKTTSKLQTGFIYHYAFSYIIGLTLVLLWVFYKGFYN